MSEVTKFRGRKAELEMTIKSLETKADGLVRSLRNDLDPTKPVSRLPGDSIAAQALDLASVLVDLEGASRELDKVRELLGER